MYYFYATPGFIFFILEVYVGSVRHGVQWDTEGVQWDTVTKYHAVPVHRANVQVHYLS